MEDVCPKGCMSYAPFPELNACKACGETRFKRVKGKDVPKKQSRRSTVKSYIKGLASNQEIAEAIQGKNRETMAAIEHGSTRITDHCGALDARALFDGTDPFKINDIMVSFNSDSTDLGKQVKSNAHVQSLLLVNGDINYRFKHSNQWILGVNGPGKPKEDLTWTFVYSTVRELEEIEESKGLKVWNVLEKRKVRTRVALVMEQGDTVEQAALNHMVAARGKKSCLVCPFAGRQVAEGAPKYAHPHLSLDDDLETPDQGLLPDLVLGRGVKELEIRQIDETIQVGQMMEGDLDAEAKRDLRRDTGISGLSIFTRLESLKRFYPWNIAQDLMHHGFANSAKHDLQLIQGTIESKLEDEGMLDDAERRLLDEGLATANRFCSPQIGEPVRVYSSKWDNWKCAERRTFFENFFLLLLHAVPLPHGVREMIASFVLLNLLLSFNAIECDPSRERRNQNPDAMEEDRPFNLDDYDFLEMPDDGIRVAPITVIEYLCREYVWLKEVTFYGRIRAFVSVCTPTLHRALHWSMMIRHLGPAFVYTQWGFEGLLGDLKRSLGSRSAPVAEMANRAKHRCLAIACRLRFNIKRPPVPRTQPFQSHSQLPDTILLLPRENGPKLEDYEETKLTEWLRKTTPASNLKHSTSFVKWGSVKLSNGYVVKSWWSEEGRRNVRGEGELIGGYGSDYCQQRYFQGTDKNGKTYYAEALSFFAIDLEGHSERRLLACIRKFTILDIYLRMFPLFEWQAERETTFVGVEEIRLPIGLVPRSRKRGEGEIWGIVTKSRAKGTRRVCIDDEDFV